MFWKRLASSAVLVVLALIFLIWGGAALGILCTVLSLIAFHELTKACHVAENKEAGALIAAGDAGIVLFGAAMLLTKNMLWGMGALVLMFLACMFVYVFRFPKYHADQVMTVFFCAFYPGVLFSFLYLTRELTWGVYLVWLIFISSWICDTCAYLTGMAIGRRKLAPVLSPKKSIEGSIGGVAGSALVGALFAWIFLLPLTNQPETVWAVALISAAGAVISQVGDLAASAIKRDHQIKDYGKLIPGHGGIMDRFDSVLFTAPVIYYLSVLLLGAVH
ncbi:MAG: phosphatidate cytidylyltransferase [Firmicutes bacterium]|nr:phosphatidate cytidylyltransferase [Bacillota bacterium]